MDKSVTEFFMKMGKVPTVTAQERRVRFVKGKPIFYDSPRIKVGFWTDDALVASEMCEKFWADVPGIYIRIEKL